MHAPSFTQPYGAYANYYQPQKATAWEKSQRHWQEQVYRRNANPEAYSRYNRPEYDAGFNLTTRRLEVFFLLLLILTGVLWQLPSTIDAVKLLYLKGDISDVDTEEKERRLRELEEQNEFRRRLKEKLVMIEPTLTDELFGEKVATIPEEDRQMVVDIQLRDLPLLTDAVFRHLEKFPNLKRLDISECVGVKGNYLATDPSSTSAFSKLETLNVSGTSIHTNDEALRNLARFASLKNLTIDQLEDSKLSLLLPKVPLESLIFTSGQQQHKLTDKGLEIIGAIHSLHKLAIGECHGVTDEGLSHLQKLSSLDHFSCTGAKITDKGLHHLSAAGGLRSLELNNCVNITDQGLMTILALFPSLEKLVLAGTNITDQAIFLLSKTRLPKISHLSVAYCKGITTEALKFVPDLVNVRNLQLEGTAIKKADVVQMKRLRPNKNMRVTVNIH